MKHFDRLNPKSEYWDDPWDKQPERKSAPQDERFRRAEPPSTAGTEWRPDSRESTYGDTVDPDEGRRPEPWSAANFDPEERPQERAPQEQRGDSPRDYGPLEQQYAPQGRGPQTPPPPGGESVSAETPKKKRRKWPWILLLIIVIAAIVAFGVIRMSSIVLYYDSDYDWYDDDDFYNYLPDDETEQETESDETEASSSEDDEAQCYLDRAETGTGVTLDIYSSEGLEELSYEEIYAQNIEAVVSIYCYQADYSGTSGTGIIFSSDGYIVTNEHVIEDAEECYVLLNDNSWYEASLVGMDEETDLAVLKIDATDLPVAEFGDSDELIVGNRCVAIGDPLGQDFRGTMTTGIISALNRDVEVNDYTMTLIQTDCALNSGNSGGPLINMYGQVIGICSMKMMSSETTVEGIGFAIPSRTVKTIVNKLIANGTVEKAMLGITAYSMSASECEEYGIDCGIMVVTVSENSDAALQGIQTGDIIVAANGTAVSTVTELNYLKGDLYPGDSITLTVLRDGVYTDYTVTLMSEDSVE